jgi:chromosomal replication initiation ATPase DnaA
MMRGSGQLVLDLPHREALGREDFLVTPSNEAAVALVDRWPDWPAPGAVLVGPPGSGKSHLLEVWRQHAHGAKSRAAELTVEAVPALLETGAVAIDDADRGIAERALFHLLNLARQQSVSVLLSCGRVPDAWSVGLPDLLSRLKALPAVNLLPPDDQLLRGVVVKLLIDRQLSPDEAVVSFIVSRMPRSLDAARLVVSELDRRALEERSDITRPFAARILLELTTRDLFREGE